MKIEKIGSIGQTVYSLTSTSDKKTLYVGLDYKNIKVYDLKTKKLTGKLKLFIFNQYKKYTVKIFNKIR